MSVPKFNRTGFDSPDLIYAKLDRLKYHGSQDSAGGCLELAKRVHYLMRLIDTRDKPADLMQTSSRINSKMRLLPILLLTLFASGCIKPTDSIKARIKLAQADISWLHQFVEEYRNKKGTLPTTLVQLGELKSRITKTPLDPWSRPYQYQVEGTDFRIFSLGKDGKPGGSGPDADIELFMSVKAKSSQ